MSKLNLTHLFAAAVGICLLAANRGWAAAEDFAQTSWNNNSGQADWVFTNNGTSATFATIPGGAPVDFQYIGADISGSLNSQLGGDLAAHLFLNATTSTPGGQLFGTIDIQPIDSGTVQILLDTPIDGKDNLLTAQFGNPDIAGTDGAPTFSFSGQDGLDGETVTFTSDFLNFGGATTGNFFQFSSANANPGLSFANDFLASFVSNGLTTYGYDNSSSSITAVPEPGTIVLFGIGAIGLCLVARRRRD